MACSKATGRDTPRRKGNPLPQLERFYHTLDLSIPLDRCISAAGYRSIRQFCKANDLSESLVGCWRMGKPHTYAGNLNALQDPECRRSAMLTEMTPVKYGISVPLSKIMLGTGCLEWELFPEVFTEGFYRGVREGLQAVPPARAYKYAPLERKELRGAIRAVLHTLPDREREVVELTFGVGPTKEELTYEQIGKRFGITRERARQLLNRAIRDLMVSSRLKRLAEVSPFPVEDRRRSTSDAMRKLWYPKGLPYRRN